MQEGDEEYLYDVPVTSVRHARQYVSARVNKEWVEDENIAIYLPSILLGSRGNLNDDDKKKLQEQGFDVDDDNLPNQENVPDSTPVVINATTVLKWKIDCIVCPERVANIQNLFASFRNYSKANVIKMSSWRQWILLKGMW